MTSLKILLFILFIASVSSLGTCIIQKILKIHLNNTISKIVINYSTGFLILSLLLMITYFFDKGIIRTALLIVIGSLLLLSLIAYIPIIMRTFLNALKQVKIQNAYLVLGVIVALYLIIECFAPINITDSLRMHAVVPQLLSNGYNLMDFKISYFYYPLGTQVIYAFIKTIFGNDLFLRLFGFCNFIMVLLALYSATFLVFRKKKIALFSVIIALTMPIFSTRYPNSLYVDISLVIFFFSAITLIFLMDNKKKINTYLFLAILFMFFTASIKVQGIIYIPILFFILIYHCHKKKMLLKKYFLSKLLIYTLFGILLTAPWYLRSYKKTGDFFGNAGKNLVEQINKKEDNNLWNRVFTNQPGRLEAEKDHSIKNYRGRTGKWYGILLTPWDLTVHGKRGGYWIGPVFLSFLLLYIFYYKKMKNHYINFLLLLIFISIILWFYIHHHGNNRYLFPVFGIFCIVSSYVYYKALYIKQKLISKFVTPYLFLILAINIIIIPLTLELKYIFYSKTPTELTTALNIYSNKQFIRSVGSAGAGWYETNQFLKTIPENDKILTNLWEIYYIDNELYNQLTLPQYFQRNYNSLKQFLNYCEKNRFIYFLYKKNYEPEGLKININGQLINVKNINTLKKVFQEGEYTLYQI